MITRIGARELAVRREARPRAVRRAPESRFADQEEVAVAGEEDRVADQIVAGVDQATVQRRQQRRAFDGFADGSVRKPLHVLLTERSLGADQPIAERARVRRHAQERVAGDVQLQSQIGPFDVDGALDQLARGHGSVPLTYFPKP